MRALRLLFFFYLFIELIGVLYVANRWGVFGMFAEVIVSAFIGVLVLINTQASISDTLGGLRQSRVGAKDFIRGNFAKVFGGILLVLPGVFCDIFGVIILINAYFILKNSHDGPYPPRSQHQEEEIIDIEVVQDGVEK